MLQRIGKYEILEQIGRGGQGTVYRARDTGLDRIVAIKVIDQSVADDPGYLDALRREAQLAASLDHPNIVTVHAFEVENDTAYIVMEYVPDALDRQIRSGRLEPLRAVSIAEQVCRALAHAHELGVVHRDVKPANILLTANGDAKISDFGIARAIDSSTRAPRTSAAGTYAYLPPEQWEENPAVDRRSDIYALGVTLFEMLAGAVPFTGNSVIEIHRQHQQDPVPPLPRNISAPSGLGDILQKAMAKRPELRFQNAGDMANELGGLFGTSGGGSRPLSASTPAPPVYPPKLPVASADGGGRTGGIPSWLLFGGLGAITMAVIAIVITIAAGGSGNGETAQVVIPSDTPTPAQVVIPEAGESAPVSCQPLSIVEATGLVPDNLRTQADGFDDPRFNWKAITDGNYTVHYYGDIDLAAAVISGAREGSYRLKNFVTTFPRNRVDIFLYKNSADLTRVVPATYPSLVGINYLGATLVDERVLLVSGGVTLDVASTTVYELTVLTVRETSGSAIPQWLVDGLAAYTSCHGDDYPAALRYGIFTKRIMPLGDKVDSAEDIIIQIGQSLSVVEFLISNYGEERMARLLEAIKERGEIDLALEQVYGFSQSDLDREWRLSVLLDPLPATPATNRPAPPTDKPVPPTEKPVPPTEKPGPPNPGPPSSTPTFSVAFVSKWGTEGTGDGEFFWPSGVAVASDGSVYVADYMNNRIQKFTSEGVFVTKWGTYDGGDGQFDFPSGVAVASDGSVYVSDSQNRRIQKFTSEGVFVTKWGTRGSGDGEFFGPSDVAVASDGSVYVADSGNNRIQKFTSEGVFVGEWGTRSSGVAVGSDGSVYVSDLSRRIQKFTSEGVFITKWGASAPFAGTGDGEFDNPVGVAVASDGSVYVADSGNNRIQKFTSEGVFVGEWGTRGSGDGEFSGPSDVAVASDGSVYVADRGNSRIQKFSVVE